MPELPEVQTIVTQLQHKIIGREIQQVRSAWPKAVRPTMDEFSLRVRGAVITGIRRFGKHIVIDTNTDESILIHLKMTGHLLVKTKSNRSDEAFKDPYNQFIHHIITLDEGVTVEFSDMRKFGWMEVVKTSDVEIFPGIKTLGIDAISEKLTLPIFREILKKSPATSIGVLLLRQECIAGIGNIYRSEALFLAGIRPTRRVLRITKKEAEQLLQSIQKVLRRALLYRGMSDGDFRDTDGRAGEFQKELGVYGQQGKPCPVCGTMIQRLKMGQRSVFYCTQCQK